MQKRSLCALAVLATFGMTTGAMAADANVKLETPDDVNAHQDITVGGSDTNYSANYVKGDISLNSVTFGDEKNDKTYFKLFGTGTTAVDKVVVQKGKKGTFEFWPTDWEKNDVKLTEGKVDGKYLTDKQYEGAKGVDIGTLVLESNSELFVQSSQDIFYGLYSSGEDSVSSAYSQHRADNYLGATTFHVDNAVMAKGSTLKLGYTSNEANKTDKGDSNKKNKIGAQNQSIDTIWAGYVVDENGGFEIDAGESSGVVISANRNPNLTVGVINVGNTKLDLAGNGDTGAATNLLGKNGTLTANLLAASSQITFGTIGMDKEPVLKIEEVDPVDSKKALTLEETPASGTPTTVVINYSDAALNSTSSTTAVTFGGDVADGSTIRATASGDLVGGEGTETAKNVAEKLVDKTFGTQGSSVVGEGITTQVEVTAAGIQDGVIYDVVAPAEGETGPVLGNEYTVENDVTSSLSQLAAVGFMQWRAEMNDMQHRLGEVRDHQGLNNGAWARAFQGQDEYGSKNVENDYYGVQVGYDHKIEGTNVLLGGAFSYTHGDSTFDVGEGDNYTYALTAYGTWLAENGMFVDGTLKYGRLSSDVDLATAQSGQLLSGSMDYDTQAMSASIEAGWRFPVASFAYIEPQLEVMYGHIWSDNASWNDIDVMIESADTLVGRAGFMAGLTCPNKKGGAYLRASVLHDWEGDADTTFRQEGGVPRTLTEELGDTWYELGIGAHWNVTDTTYIYGDFEYADGGEIDTPWKYSIGVRHAF